MELFRRRFLSFFCFLFLTTSLFLYIGDFENKLRLIISLLIVIATILILMAVLKKCRIALLCVLLCCCSITCAAANSFLRIDYQTLKAQEYVGDFDAQMSILECKYVSGNSATYIVRLDKLGESNVAIKALLVCGFSTELSMGDRVFANVEIVGMEDRAFGLTGRERSDDPEVMLTAVLYDGVEATVERFDHEASFVEKLFYKNGARVLFEEIRTDLKIHIDETFGEDIGALAKGYLLGDKSDISTDVIRDFRRSGVSHLFAVSGLHISILLGAVELLLRKLWVDKRIRCVIISILSVVLLILTGFSISALRAVFMLWVVYLVFLFSEEADPPTTLFVSVAIIILFFPYAIGELGLWMSFLATLGLVTVYPVAEEYIRKIPDGKGAKRISVKILKSAVLIIVMTVTANVFQIGRAHV